MTDETPTPTLPSQTIALLISHLLASIQGIEQAAHQTVAHLNDCACAVTALNQRIDALQESHESLLRQHRPSTYADIPQ